MCAAQEVRLFMIEGNCLLNNFLQFIYFINFEQTCFIITEKQTFALFIYLYVWYVVIFGNNEQTTEYMLSVSTSGTAPSTSYCAKRRGLFECALHQISSVLGCVFHRCSEGFSLKRSSFPVAFGFSNVTKPLARQ